MNEYLTAYDRYEADRGVAAKFIEADKLTALPIKQDGSAYVAIQDQGDCATNGQMGRYKKAADGSELPLPA